MSGNSAEFVFVARESKEGAPLVVLQPKHGGIELLKGEIGLDLYRGTSLQEAKQLARFLNSNIKSVSYRGESGAEAALSSR